MGLRSKIINKLRKISFSHLAKRKFHFQSPPNITHQKWDKYLSEKFDKPGMRILEIGSRVVTGSNFRTNFSNATYVGFDYYPGQNVDIIGDAHKLSTYFEKNEKFDLIFSSAVFEHLCMPWIVAEEIQKLLKVGGCVFIETHFSFSAHEIPWNFFQFSHFGLRALFNKALGFDLIEYGLSNPMYGFFSNNANEYLRHHEINELYCHSEILCKKTREITNFDWRNISTSEIVDESVYPQPRD